MLHKLSLSAFLFFCLFIFSCDTVNEASEPDYYIASSKSDVFHKPDCSYVENILAQNKRTFDTRDQAINAGYRPCSKCNP
jgi:methylphosphotriester-DNA--protein-cysteine methyltransferase